MTTTTSTRWLKRGLHRSVALRAGPDGAPEVVKHYRSRGWLRRLGDRRRAERELRLLRELHAAGLHVPRPRGAERVEDGWELTAEWIEGARSVAELLRDPTDLPAPPELLARRLGTLVGHAHALGLAHGDLHAGNLLVDAAGEAWLVDVAGARLGPPLTDEALERDLVGLAADAREFTTLRQRQRFLVSWRRRLGAERSAPFRRADRLTTLELRARDQRREALLEHADRWTRPSGLCEERDLPGGRALVARCGAEGLLRDPGALQQLAARAAAGESKTRLGGVAVTLDGDPGASARWTTLGRAWQHGLPTLTPLALLRLTRGDTAAYVTPPGAEPDPEAKAPGVPRTNEALRERGFQFEGDGLWREADGATRLGPGCALRVEGCRG